VCLRVVSSATAFTGLRSFQVPWQSLRIELPLGVVLESRDGLLGLLLGGPAAEVYSGIAECEPLGCLGAYASCCALHKHHAALQVVGGGRPR
jgi:hypothetical protein